MIAAPMKRTVANGVVTIVNSPLGVHGGGQLPAVVTSKHGARAPIYIEQLGTWTRDYHDGVDLWVFEGALPDKEARVRPAAPMRFVASWDSVGLGRVVLVEHPPLEDGRRVFSLSVHLDPDVAILSGPVGALFPKGHDVGAMGNTGAANGEHLHHELLVEQRPGLLAQMLAMSHDTNLATLVTTRGALAPAPSVDWTADRWLDYFNQWEWGDSWPHAEATQRLQLAELVAWVNDAYDQRFDPDALSIIEYVPASPPWDLEAILRRRKRR